MTCIHFFVVLTLKLNTNLCSWVRVGLVRRKPFTGILGRIPRIDGRNSGSYTLGSYTLNYKEKKMITIHFPVKSHCSKESTKSLEGASGLEWIFQRTISALSTEAACIGRSSICSLDEWGECHERLGSPYLTRSFLLTRVLIISICIHWAWLR